MAYRSSAGDLGYYEDSRRSGERWDRDRFERYGRRPVDERDSFRFEERDRFDGGRERRDIEINDKYERRGPRVMEKERYVEEDRYDRSRRRPKFLDEPTPSEVANQALAPYRRKSIVEEDVEFSSRPRRPQYIRRQSSLDTFDRRPLPRYSEHDREEWRPPTNMPIPLPIRDRSRREPSPRRVYRDDEYERVRYRDSDGDFFDEVREEDYRDVSVRRNKSRHRRRSSAHGSRAHSSGRRSSRARSIGRRSSRASSVSSSSSPSPVRNIGKRGRTRMPKRLVVVQAVLDKGYPYEEEGDFIVIKRALEKEHIDEIIKLSESYREKSTYVYEDRDGHEDITETTTTTVVSPPAPESVRSRRTSRPAIPRPVSPSRQTVIEEQIEESATIKGPLALIAPQDRHSRSERDIKDEIRALEAERALLRYERESEVDIVERRPREVEIIERRPKEVVRVEKDRKGPNPKVIAAMMATLT